VSVFPAIRRVPLAEIFPVAGQSQSGQWAAVPQFLFLMRYSGKSTTLKNFQLHFSPKAFDAERPRWKIVIHLNLVRSLRKIHRALMSYSATQGLGRAHVSSPAPPMDVGIYNEPSDLYGVTSMGCEEEYDPNVPSQPKWPKLSLQHHLLLLRLLPILSLERQLLRALFPNSHSLGTAMNPNTPGRTPLHNGMNNSKNLPIVSCQPTLGPPYVSHHSPYWTKFPFQLP